MLTHGPRPPRWQLKLILCRKSGGAIILYSDNAKACVAQSWLAVLALLVSGCGETDPPDLPPLYDVAFTEELAVAAGGDSALIAIGTGGPLYSYRETNVYLDMSGSSDENINLRIHVIGKTYDASARAIVEHRWGDDTLFVWCDLNPPMTWDYHVIADKTTPATPWLFADRIDISAPPGVGIRYIGRWMPYLLE